MPPASQSLNYPPAFGAATEGRNLPDVQPGRGNIWHPFSKTNEAPHTLHISNPRRITDSRNMQCTTALCVVNSRSFAAMLKRNGPFHEATLRHDTHTPQHAQTHHGETNHPDSPPPPSREASRRKVRPLSVTPNDEHVHPLPWAISKTTTRLPQILQNTT